MKLALALDTADAATGALVVLAAAQRAHPELEVPSDLGPRLARIAFRSLDLALPAPAPPRPKRLKVKASNNKHPVQVVSSWSRPSDPFMEASCCRALLLEIIRRAAYDWVLYRLSSDMANKKVAEDAYYWLFKEQPGTKAWRERQDSGKHLTAFLSICDSLDLDPGMVRSTVKRLTVKNVMSVGRPAERRHSASEEMMTAGTEVHLPFAVLNHVESVAG
jgi:hypothetical protein